MPAVVSRMRAFTIAAGWIVAGLAGGIVAFAAATGALSDGLRATVVSSALWGGVFLPACLVVAGLWVGVGARNARSSASLGGQAALFGLAAALVAVLVLAALTPVLGDAAN